MDVDCSGGTATVRENISIENNNNNNNSRWNPTKEQINMLENLYRQGVRTPSAEQIQQITSRLKAYGNIEGKNVFYWFQNHKARQRQKQKQKQESFAYLNRYFHHSAIAAAQYPALVYPPPSQNVVCGPCFIPQGEAPTGLYPQYPRVIVPTPYKRKLRRDKVIEKARVTTSCTVPGHDDHLNNCSAADHNPMVLTTGSNQEGTAINRSACNSCHETLDLFPLHPTGILDDQARSVSSGRGENSSTSQSSVIVGFDDQQPFFDFFSSDQGSCHRDC